MNCFVIMPFSSEFDDVYLTIKRAVTDAASPRECRCFRLDEARPAGRITERLLGELRTASLCVADITGNRPNVMWEVGYAMALGCPVVLLSQSLDDLPFDIKDMQAIHYDRGRLNSTLGQPLQKAIIDTISALNGADAPISHDNLVGQLLSEITDLKHMVSKAVQLWNPGPATMPPQSSESLLGMAGAWLDLESGSHMYGSIIDNDLIVPYCYSGNDSLTGVFFGWRQEGDFWFTKFLWREGEVSGFAFLRQSSIDTLRGAWWSDDELAHPPTAMPAGGGVSIRLERKWPETTPVWATRFFSEARTSGIQRALESAMG